MLRAVEVGAAGYFVAGFGLDVVAARGGAGFRGHGFGGGGGMGWREEGACRGMIEKP